MKLISATVGVILLIAALLLSYLASSNGEAMLAKKDAKVVEYVNKSKEALAVENIESALKYAKLAIEVDPKNNKAFQAYDAVLKFKYKPKESDAVNTLQRVQPSSDEDEEDEDAASGVIKVDMGC